jgi:hypothetical protein
MTFGLPPSGTGSNMQRMGFSTLIVNYFPRSDAVPYFIKTAGNALVKCFKSNVVNQRIALLKRKGEQLDPNNEEDADEGTDIEQEIQYLLHYYRNHKLQTVQ